MKSAPDLMVKAAKYPTILKLLRAALPAMLAAGFSFFNVFLPARSGQLGIDTMRIESGSCLISGVPNDNITWVMPLFKTVASAVVNSGADPDYFLAALHLALYLLVFCAGCLLRGYRTGLLALAGAGALEAAGVIPYDNEQAFYSFSVLLAFILLLLRDRDGTLKSGVLAGLAIGASLLVRTPLLLLPPAVALLDWVGRRELARAFALRALALLAASYILLVPWGLLNYSLSGRFSLVDDSRAACNLITGVKGSVYTMEGDARKLAGLEPGDSAFSFYFREAARRPFFFAAGVLKRLWHIFLFSPLLFGLFLLALALVRGRERRAFLLPLYFIFIHALLSIEARYFYPMQHLLPPLIASVLLSLRFFREAPGPCPYGERLARAAFWAVLGAVLAVEALVAAYPYRSAHNMASLERLSEALERFPRDRFFRTVRCQLLLAEEDPKNYYECLADNSRDFGDKVGAYFLAAGESRSPSNLAVPAGLELECFTIRMLREFELGDPAAAARSFRGAYAHYERWHNMFLGEPYQKDRELAAALRSGSGFFWDDYVFRFFSMLPTARAVGTLRALQKRAPSGTQAERQIAAKTLEELERGIAGAAPACGVAEVLALGETGERMLRRRLALDAVQLPPGRRDFLWKKTAAFSKELSDRAVEKMNAADFKAAGRLLQEAAAASPANPEAFMNLCYLWSREGQMGKALGACRSAACAVYFNPENKLDSYGTLAGAALFRSYELLLTSGRRTEAGKVLRKAVERAPAAWPGLPKARTALAAFEKKR